MAKKAARSKSSATAASGAAFEYLLGGAGSHKTTELCKRALDYLVTSAAHPSTLVLTTYSRDAAGQLLDRLRSLTLQHASLPWATKREIIAALDVATISTSHALGRAAVEQHWLERSAVPAPTVVDNATYEKLAYAAIRTALRSGLPTGKRTSLRSLIRRLGRGQAEPRRDGSVSGHVMNDIRLLMHMVPESGLSAAAFARKCAAAIDDLSRELANERRIRGMTGTASALLAACRTASAQLQPIASAYGGQTAGALQAIEEYIAKQAWHRAHKLTKVKGHARGKPTPPQQFVAPVVAAATDYHLFPEFSRDLRRYIRLVARVAHVAYHNFRSMLFRAGRIDFAEMEQAFNNLLDDAAIRTPLASAYGFIGIDEAQDMTAASAEAFGKLTAAVRSGAWIADPNQSIYQFRGADHHAVHVAAKALVKSLAGRSSSHGQNHRSRPGVVRFVNDLFHILTSGGCPAQPLPSSHAQDVPKARAALKGRIERWALQGAKEGEWCAELAEGVQRLRARSPTPVADEDICILVRTNDNKKAAAAALQERGIPVAMRAADVTETREGRILLAAIRLMLDATDTLAEATLRFLLDDRSIAGTANPDFDRWLQDKIAAAAPLPAPPYILVLEDVRERGILPALSPMSAVLLAIEVTGVVGRIAAWGNGIERQSHIDAMLTLARGYEKAATAAGRLATIAGFMVWCAEKRRSPGNGEPDSDAPPKEMPGVRVMTCHASKGLGFKVTIVACFGMPAAVNRVYGISTVGGNPHAIPDPIKDSKNDDLVRIINNLPASGQRQLDGLAAETQLLYVSLTRSEQELIIAHPNSVSDNTWLTGIFGVGNPAAGRLAGIDHFLERNPAATSVLHPLPAPPAPSPTTGVKLQPADYAYVDDLTTRAGGGAAPKATTVDVFDTSAPRALSAVAAPARYRSPSGNGVVIGGWKNSGSQLDVPLPAGVPRNLMNAALKSHVKGVANALGDAFHAFMAAIPSLPALDATTRPLWDQVAARCLAGFLEARVVTALAATGLTPTVCVDRAEAFVEWCRMHLGVEPADWIVEAGVAGPAGAGGTWRGRVDLLTRAKSGASAGKWVLVDHKAVLATTAECMAKADEYLGEVSAYAEALATMKPASLSPEVIFIHFPLAGTIIPITKP